MDIPLVRAQHLLLYVDLLRDIGAPVEAELGRSRLPGWIEEMPDAHVSLPLTLEWIGRAGRDAPPMELGYLASKRASLGTLHREVSRAVVAAPTGLARMQALARVAHREDSAARVELRREGEQVRVICHMPGFEDNPCLAFAEWLNLEIVVSVLQSAAGEKWRPSEMTFVSGSQPSEAALAAYGNTRIRLGQRHSSVVIPADLLGRACADALPSSLPSAGLANTVEEWSFLAALRSIIRPYIGQGYPDLALVAEIIGTSPRTLQRRLAEHGRSYSEVVQEARFGIAAELLADPSMRIIDVALTAGYENPQHFSRAFRRLTGLSPRAYRAGLGPIA